MKKHIQLFEEFISNRNMYDINESISGNTDTKLLAAARLIMSLINKKTGKNYIVSPLLSYNDEMLPAIYMYSDKDLSAVCVIGGGKTGIVGKLEYQSDPGSNRVDFSVSSENFPIVSLINEFIRLISDPSYLRAVEKLNESSLYEAKKPLTQDDISEIQRRLEGGESASEISKSMGVSYGAILHLRKNITVGEVKIPVVKKNEETLQDKVKYLDEILEDIYEVASVMASRGPFNSLFISGRAGTGKTYSVEKALEDNGLVEDQDYTYIKGTVSVPIMYKKMYQYKDQIIVFDDCDAVFRDESGRNILKSALDTKKVRRIAYLKKASMVYDPKDYENDPEGELDALERGEIPAYFDFRGKVIFISNLAKEKADPDGALRTRSVLIDVNPDDATLLERIKILLPYLEPKDMPLADKEEVFNFIKNTPNISMRTFVKAAEFKQIGMKNWKRMVERYV